MTKGITINELIEQLEGKNDIRKTMLIDTIDFLKELKPYESTHITVTDTCTHCDSKIHKTLSAYEGFIHMLSNGELEEIEFNNTSMWNSPISHDIAWDIYRDIELDAYIVSLKVHKFGENDNNEDNYNDSVILLFEDEVTIKELLRECNTVVDIEVDGEMYDVLLSIDHDEVVIYHSHSGNKINFEIEEKDRRNLKEKVESYIRENKEVNNDGK